jgi:FkbM family methyltransferase
MFDDLLYRVSESDRVRRWVTPLLRAYLRYAPFAASKEALWNTVVEPYFAWHPHEFLASTVFHRKIAGDTQDFIQQCIYYQGIWEPHLTHWIRRRLTPGDTFVDVGANIGYFSLLASQRVGPAGTVVALEASPGIFGALQRNLALNRAHNVRAVNVAVSDAEGMLRLFRGLSHNIGETTVVPQEGFELECEVRAAPLGTLLRPEEACNVRLVKIDVEGAEWSVVTGMIPLLEQSNPDLEVIVEVHPELLARQGRRPEGLLGLFHDAGFYAYHLEKDFVQFPGSSPPKEIRPRRLPADATVDEETDVVFSRQDAKQL